MLKKNGQNHQTMTKPKITFRPIYTAPRVKTAILRPMPRRIVPVTVLLAQLNVGEESAPTDT